MDAFNDEAAWLFLDLNSYFASVEQQVRPELRGKPVGVVPVMADTTCCIAASYEAKAFGVKTGTKVADAKILCPGIRLVEARPALYVRYHEAIVKTVESCIPVAHVMSIDEMVCELLGSQRQIPNAVALAAHIKATLRKRVGEYLRCSIGIAPNRFLAKLAGDMQKPDGLTIIRQSQLPHQLHHLKLRDLPGVGSNMEIRLNEFGISTMEQLCRLDKKSMHDAWGGIVGGRFYEYLRGVDLEEPETVRRSIGHSHVMEPSLRSRQGAIRVSHQLLSKAAVRLRKMEYWTAGLSLWIQLMGEGHHEARIKLAEIQDTPALLKALNTLWQKIPLTGKPLKVGVTFSPLVARDHHTPSLFDNPKQEKVSRVMDGINDDQGRNTIYFGALQKALDDAPTRIAFTRIPDISEM